MEDCTTYHILTSYRNSTTLKEWSLVVPSCFKFSILICLLGLNLISSYLLFQLFRFIFGFTEFEFEFGKYFSSFVFVKLTGTVQFWFKLKSKKFKKFVTKIVTKNCLCCTFNNDSPHLNLFWIVLVLDFYLIQFFLNI